MSDRKPKFQIGDIVTLSDAPTIKGFNNLEKLRFYTIVKYKLGSQKYTYQVNGLDTWFAERNFDLYSKAENEWVPFEKCKNIKVGDHVKLDYDTYRHETSKNINKIFDIHEYRVISEIGKQYILIEGDDYPIHPSFLLYKKPNVSQIKPETNKNERDIFAVDLDKSENNKVEIVYIEEDIEKSADEIKESENYVVSEDIVNDFCKSPKIACYPALEDMQIFDAMQKTLDAARYSAFPFGSPDYLINVKLGGSYNKK